MRKVKRCIILFPLFSFCLSNPASAYSQQSICTITGNTPLHIAVDARNLTTVNHLVNNSHANVNAKENNGYTPLHNAARVGDLQIVKFLLKNGAQLDSKNRYGDTPLHIAIQNENWDAAKYLKNQGADLFCQNSLGQSPMDTLLIKMTISYAKGGTSFYDALDEAADLGIITHPEKWEYWECNVKKSRILCPASKAFASFLCSLYDPFQLTATFTFFVLYTTGHFSPTNIP